MFVHTGREYSSEIGGFAMLLAGFIAGQFF